MKHSTRIRTTLTAFCAALLLGGLTAAAPLDPVPTSLPSATTSVDDGYWIAKSADNICGLRDARTLSNPAKVDFDKLLKATPEMKKIEKDDIDRNSPEGIQLIQKAVDRVTKACKKVMGEKGHCSVWKKIRHSEGRPVADVTDEVLAKL